MSNNDKPRVFSLSDIILDHRTVLATSIAFFKTSMFFTTYISGNETWKLFISFLLHLTTWERLHLTIFGCDCTCGLNLTFKSQYVTSRYWSRLEISTRVLKFVFKFNHINGFDRWLVETSFWHSKNAIYPRFWNLNLTLKCINTWFCSLALNVVGKNCVVMLDLSQLWQPQQLVYGGSKQNEILHFNLQCTTTSNTSKIVIWPDFLSKVFPYFRYEYHPLCNVNFQIECDKINVLPHVVFTIGGNNFNLTGKDYTQRVGIGKTHLVHFEM